MPVIRPRNRLIYFRVSEEEYQRYNQICETNGSRSISDMARSAMETMTENARNQSEQISERLELLESAVSDLNRMIRQLSVSLGGRTCLGPVEHEQLQISDNKV